MLYIDFVFSIDRLATIDSF